MKNKIEFFFQAVLFDCDGVLADNEKEGHQEAFNEAFNALGLNIYWDDNTYRELIKIGGGKERLKYFFDKTAWPVAIADKEKLIGELHNRKTQFYINFVRSGKIHVRPGVTEFINLLIEQKIPYGICSTSNEKAVRSLLKVLFDDKVLNNLQFLLAGDMVKNKKPDPEIYLSAAKQLNVLPENCLVIEDSEVGIKAAKAAGMKVIVTKSFYTKGDDFSGADLVFENLDGLEVTKRRTEKGNHKNI